MAAAEDHSRITTFQHHIDDMRNLVMCKICLKPLYEPFILGCGHTYCYGCLRSWFVGLDNRRRNKNCPDCRADVKLTPSPNYILRDLVHMFIGRAELLPEDETVDEHKAWSIAEADILTADREGSGLFQGIFKMRMHPLAEFGPLHDISDGVLRCPHCHWEIEEGMCIQCGYEIDDDEYPDFSDEDEEGSMLSDSEMDDDSDQASIHGLPLHFYEARSAADDIDQTVSSDVNSETGYPPPYHGDDDEDDLDGFIDDHFHEDSEPDEVDDDGIDLDALVATYRPRARNHRVLDDEEEEDDSQEEGGSHGTPEPYERNSNSAFDSSGVSENEETYGSQGNSDEQEQLTNYDESDNESRISTPVPRRVLPRRRPIVISDDEDEDEDGSEEIAESRTVGRSRSPATDASSHVSDSDDTATPPQPSAYRRQRLDVRRKRRRTPDTWRAIARGRERPLGRRESHTGSNDMHQSRAESNYLGVAS